MKTDETDEAMSPVAFLMESPPIAEPTESRRAEVGQERRGNSGHSSDGTAEMPRLGEPS